MFIYIGYECTYAQVHTVHNLILKKIFAIKVFALFYFYSNMKIEEWKEEEKHITITVNSNAIKRHKMR